MRLDHSVLVLVDYQERLMPAMDRGEVVVAEALRLADVAASLGVPIIGTEQNPASLGLNVDEIRRRCGRTVQKTHFDACADGLLDVVAEALPKDSARPPLDIVIAGCEAHVCLLQTSVGLMNAGHRVWVVAEACTSRLPYNYKQAMRRLRQGGAGLVTFEMVAFEWMRDCRHENFKTVLPLLKAPLATSPTLPQAGKTKESNMSNHQKPRELPHAELVDFEAQLKAEGFVELQTREINAGTHNPAHAHDFEVKALMLDGELRIDCDGKSTSYTTGDVFTMAAGRQHAEQFGASGARYLTGRKYPG